MKYWLPNNVIVKNLPEKYTKETKITFIDDRYGEFISSFKAIQDAKASTHPKAVSERRKNTNIERYGVENPTQNKQIREKVTNTILERFGVKNALENKELLKKSRETLKQNYNVDHPMYSKELKEKQKNTVINKFGVNNVMKHEDVKQSLKESVKEKYGVENIMLCEEGRERHQEGVLKWQQNVGRLNILPNNKTVSQTCRDKGVWYSQRANQIYRENGPEVAQKWIENHDQLVSALELDFQDMFPTAQRCNKKLYNHNYRPDFVLIGKNNIVLNVDIDGLFVHSERRKSNDYHKKKREAYEKEGLNYIQIHQDELIYKSDIVKSIINNKLGLCTKKYGARNLSVKLISCSEGSEFFNKNHLMGGYPSAKHVALIDNNGIIISCMSYKKNGNGLEISRFASLLNVVVIGGLSKLLSYIIKKENPKNLIYFVDLRYATGKSVQQLGFKLDHITLGFLWTDGRNTFHRRYCRANMDDRNLSEKEHAKEKGIFKIFDAGQAKFVLDLTTNSL